MVIPAMDHIDSVLTDGILNSKALNPAIRAVLRLAKHTLNRYYSLTDTSETYRITMILHPHHKLEYFKVASWEKEWIQMAQDMVWDEYEWSYASHTHINPGAQKTIATTNVKEDKDSNIFDNLPALKKPKTAPLQSKLDAYLNTPIEDVDNVLKWWLRQVKTYPHLL
ncbi:hypothetical protein PAXINDRAFT_6879 [Paxillus involutus ATCC 200175]|nr:hypothetical protein PAXINDRAFT_6879 [Paxillus involutus ATCC 200175]